jgi:WS/DGAT/MGAT family acyltransferase
MPYPRATVSRTLSGPDAGHLPLAGVDAAWLRMDSPENLMHIHGVLVLAGDVERERVADVLRARLLRVPRFHQRIESGPEGPVWASDPEFELDRHVTEERLPAPGGDAELAAAIGAHLHRPFDRRYPLWEFRVLRGYRGGDTAVFGRLHHVLGDGVALMVVLLALTDLEADEAAAVGGSGPSRTGNPFFDLLVATSDEARHAAHDAAERWMPETLRLMQAPVEAYARAGALGRAAGEAVALARLVARPADPRTPFRGRLGIEKRVAWTEAVPLDRLKDLSRALGATLNDVLNTAMAGGLRRYLAARPGYGAPRESLAFRCAMPVNLRPLEEMAALGNRFGLIFLSLPVGVEDPLARLEAMRRRAAALKRSAEPLVVFRILQRMGRLPERARRMLLALFAAKATAVFTNVPGPRSTLDFAGRPVRDFFFWVPQAGRVGLGVSILSYAGRVRMGVGTDAGLVPDPERIVDGFHAELERLFARAG